MGSLAQAKALGGVGSILVILAVVPYAGFILGIVGFILVLIAVKYISDAVGDKSIFNNMLISVILAILGIAVGAAVLFASLFPFFTTPRFFEGEFEPAAVMGPAFLNFIFTIILGLALIWIFYIISAVFLRRSFNTIASSLNVGMFSTAALLYLIGAVLVVIMVGFVVIFVAEILQAVAFFSIPEQTSSSQQPS